MDLGYVAGKETVRESVALVSSFIEDLKLMVNERSMILYKRSPYQLAVDT